MQERQRQASEAISFIYVVTFHAWGGPTLWKGVLIGAVHAAFVLGVLLPALPAVHPRMASRTWCSARSSGLATSRRDS